MRGKTYIDISNDTLRDVVADWVKKIMPKQRVTVITVMPNGNGMTRITLEEAPQESPASPNFLKANRRIEMEGR